MAQVKVSDALMAEVPDQFVDYMVLNKINLDSRHHIYQCEKDGIETLLNNYVSLQATIC